MALKYDCIFATFASFNRYFSNACLTAVKLQSHLTGKYVENLNVLHCNNLVLWLGFCCCRRPINAFMMIVIITEKGILHSGLGLTIGSGYFAVDGNLPLESILP